MNESISLELVDNLAYPLPDSDDHYSASVEASGPSGEICLKVNGTVILAADRAAWLAMCRASLELFK